MSGGIRRDEPNQFDSLCDGVLNTLAIVHAAVLEVSIDTSSATHLKQIISFLLHSSS